MNRLPADQAWDSLEESKQNRLPCFLEDQDKGAGDGATGREPRLRLRALLTPRRAYHQRELS